MAREIYCKDVKFSQYSQWHRSLHSGLAMCDLDAIEMCIACNKPLVLIETARDVNQEYRKGHSMTRQLAISAGIPAFIIWYKFINDKPIRVKIKKIAPDYKHGYSSAPEDHPFDHWKKYLETKQAKHFYHCPKQSLFIEKISKDTELRSSRIYAPILSL